MESQREFIRGGSCRVLVEPQAATGDPVLWDSKIRLGEGFFNEIIRHPIPAGHEHPESAQAVPAWAWTSTCGSATGRSP